MTPWTGGFLRLVYNKQISRIPVDLEILQVFSTGKSHPKLLPSTLYMDLNRSIRKPKNSCMFQIHQKPKNISMFLLALKLVTLQFTQKPAPKKCVSACPPLCVPGVTKGPQSKARDGKEGNRNDTKNKLHLICWPRPGKGPTRCTVPPFFWAR